jgi:hypothetical protein
MPRPGSHARAWLAAVLVGVVLVWALDLAVLRAGVPHPLDDVWEYGTTARHLLQGQGFRTSVIHPPLWGLRDGALTVPVLVHGPLLPVLYAPLLALGGPALLDRVAWLAAFFATLTALLLFLLGSRHAGPAVGAAAALAFTCAPLTVRAVNHDASMVVGGFLLLLAFERLARDPPRHAAAAIALGLATLVRPEAPLALAGLSMLAGGWGTVSLLLGLALFAGAWWWHNLAATGSPFFNLSSYMAVGYSERWPGLRPLRDFSLNPVRWPQVLLEQASWLPGKALANLPHALKRAALAPSPWTGWLAALGAGIGMARASTRWIALAATLCALVPVAVMTLTTFDARYITPFLPLWALSAALAAEWLGGRLPRAGRSGAWVAALLLLILPATVAALREDAREARGLEVRLAHERAALARLATPEARLPRLGLLGLERPADTGRTPPRLLFSDTPDFVAWTTGRPTVWVTSRQWEDLPASAPPGVARRRPGSTPADSLPPRGGPADTWFHADPEP